MIFPALRAAVFVHGCFWHGHDCRFFRLPGTRPDFWGAKIARNRERDAEVRTQLAEAGWRYLVVWECALRGQGRDAPEAVANGVAAWLRSKAASSEIRGP
jgi:DNA mismatch endonuclease (patch repair protein)